MVASTTRLLAVGSSFMSMFFSQEERKEKAIRNKPKYEDGKRDLQL
jgi:hypothetical protein